MTENDFKTGEHQMMITESIFRKNKGSDIVVNENGNNSQPYPKD